MIFLASVWSGVALLYSLALKTTQLPSCEFMWTDSLFYPFKRLQQYQNIAHFQLGLLVQHRRAHQHWPSGCPSRRQCGPSGPWITSQQPCRLQFTSWSQQHLWTSLNPFSTNTDWLLPFWRRKREKYSWSLRNFVNCISFLVGRDLFSVKSELLQCSVPKMNTEVVVSNILAEF